VYRLRLQKYQNPHHDRFQKSVKAISRHDLADEMLDGSTSHLAAENDRMNTEAIHTMNKMLAPLLDESAEATRGRKRKRTLSPARVTDKSQTTGEHE
jgi:hypothetical protein